MRAAERFRNRCALAYIRFPLLREDALYSRLFIGHAQMQSQLIHVNRARCNGIRRVRETRLIRRLHCALEHHRPRSGHFADARNRESGELR